MLDSGFWNLDAGFCILDAGFWILDLGFWVLESGFWIPDSVFWIWILLPPFDSVSEPACRNRYQNLRESVSESAESASKSAGLGVRICMNRYQKESASESAVSVSESAGIGIRVCSICIRICGIDIRICRIGIRIFRIGIRICRNLQKIAKSAKIYKKTAKICIRSIGVGLGAKYCKMQRKSMIFEAKTRLEKGRKGGRAVLSSALHAFRIRIGFRNRISVTGSNTAEPAGGLAVFQAVHAFRRAGRKTCCLFLSHKPAWCTLNWTLSPSYDTQGASQKLLTTCFDPRWDFSNLQWSAETAEPVTRGPPRVVGDKSRILINQR